MAGAARRARRRQVSDDVALDQPPALELRLALLQEGGEALLRVGDHGRRRHELDRERVGAVLVPADLRVEALLAQALGLDAAPRGAGDEVPRRLVELVSRYGLVDQAPVGRGAGVDRVTGEGHLQRSLAADVAGHGDERRVAEQPALASGDGERRVLRGHGEVARRDELAPGRGGQCVDLGDHRLRDLLDRIHHLGADLEQAPGVGQRRTPHVAEVVPGREHRPVGGQDDAERVAVAHLAQSSRQLDHHVQRQRVPLLRPVERDRRDRLVLLHEQVLDTRSCRDCRAAVTSLAQIA